MDSENDKKEEERKIFSRPFCLLAGFTNADSENDRKEEERKILPHRFCLLAGFTHAALESDRKKERRREIRNHLDLAAGGSSRGRKIAEIKFSSGLVCPRSNGGKGFNLLLKALCAAISRAFRFRRRSGGTSILIGVLRERKGGSFDSLSFCREGGGGYLPSR